MLPAGHAKRTDARLGRIIQLIEGGASQTDLQAPLKELVDADNAIVYSGFPASIIVFTACFSCLEMWFCARF